MGLLIGNPALEIFLCYLVDCVCVCVEGREGGVGGLGLLYLGEAVEYSKLFFSAVAQLFRCRSFPFIYYLSTAGCQHCHSFVMCSCAQFDWGYFSHNLARAPI